MTTDCPAATIGAMHVCRVCGVEAIELPNELAVGSVTCSACRREQRVQDYLGEAERLRSVVGHAVSTRVDYQERLVTGVTCTTCGGSTALPRDPSLQDFKCAYCGAKMPVSDPTDAPGPGGVRTHEAGGEPGRESAGGRRRQGMIVLASVVVGVMVALVFTWLSK